MFERSTENADIRPASVNGAVEVAPGDDVEAKSTKAGSEGELVFGTGIYENAASITPQATGQTWWMPFGAKFEPTGDVGVLDLTGVDDFHLKGALNVNDSENNLTSEPVVYISAAENVRIEEVHGYQVFDGVHLEDTATGTETTDVVSCEIEYLRMNEHRGDGYKLTNEVRDCKLNRCIMRSTRSGSSRGIVVDTTGTDGGNMFGDITVLDMGGNGMEVVSCSLGMWIDTAILDNNVGNGLYVNQGVKRFQAGSLFCTANDKHGAFFEGANGTEIEKAQVGNYMAALNDTTNFAGLRLNQMTDWYFGSVLSFDNDQALHFGSGGVADGHFGHLRTFSNSSGIFGSGIESNVSVGNPQIGDSFTPTDFTRLGAVGYEAAGAASTPTEANFNNGDLVLNTDDGVIWARANNNWIQMGAGNPIDLTANNGIQNGQMAIADGTATGATEGDLATWDSTAVEWNIFNADATE